MSIYSGFANRQLEANYNRLIEGTLRILQGRLLKFYEEFVEEDKNFVKLLSKNVSYLAIMERNKYLPPKLSECLNEICTFLKIEIPSNEQQSVSTSLHSSIQGGLQRNNSFTRQTNNHSPGQSNAQFKRVFSPIHNDNSTLKRSISPGQTRSISPGRPPLNLNGYNSKRQLSPTNNVNYSSKNIQNNLNTLSPRLTSNRIQTTNQNSYTTLNRDNSRGHLQTIISSNSNYQTINKPNPSYMFNQSKKQVPNINKSLQLQQQQLQQQQYQQNNNNINTNKNRSISPKGNGVIQGYYINNNNNRFQKTNSPVNNRINESSSNQSRIQQNQKSKTVSEGNSQFYDYHINDSRKNSSVQSRQFRMKTLNGSPMNQDSSYNPIVKRHNSSQIQKELSNNFGLQKNNLGLQKNNLGVQKANTNQLKRISILSKRNGESQDYGQNKQNSYNGDNRNQMYLTKQKIKQGLQQNDNNNYALVDETISQMRQQINVYCKQNKTEQNPFVISPPQQQQINSHPNNQQSQILLQQLAEQHQLHDSSNKDITQIETRSYSILKKDFNDNNNNTFD